MQALPRTALAFPWDEMICAKYVYASTEKEFPMARTFNSETGCAKHANDINTIKPKSFHSHETKVFFIVLSSLAISVNTSRHKINCIASVEPNTLHRNPRMAGTRSALLRRQRATGMEVAPVGGFNAGDFTGQPQDLAAIGIGSTLGTADSGCLGIGSLDRQGHRMCDQSQPNALSTSPLLDHQIAHHTKSWVMNM